MSSFLGVKERPNLTGGDIKTAYEAQPDTNAFTDAEKTILADNAAGLSRRFETLDEMQTQAQTYPDETLLIGGGFLFKCVSVDAHLTLSSTQKVQHVSKNGRLYLAALGPNADGETDDAALIDLLNVFGKTLDLGGADCAYSGTFSPFAKVINGRIIATNGTFDFSILTPQIPAFLPSTRWRSNYYSGTRLQIHGGEFVGMNGFRFMGTNKKIGRVVATGIDGFTDVDAADGWDLGAETTRKLDCWYSTFAVANRDQAVCDYKLMPYLRAAEVAGNIVSLGEAGESQTLPLPAVTHAWADNALAGVDCLVINEVGFWSGRVTKITANTAGTITLENIGAVFPGDFLLPAPPGYEEYVWLCDAYMDEAEWRNHADAVNFIGSTMVTVADFPTSGEVATATEYSLAGYISPLATAAIIRLNLTLSSASTGSIAQYLWMDSSGHEYWSMTEWKPLTASENQEVTDSGGDTFTYARPKSSNWPVQHSSIQAPFSRKQSLFYLTGGTLDGTIVSRTMSIRGHIIA